MSLPSPNDIASAWVEKWAAENGLPRNAAYVQLIERGLKAAGPHPGLNERPLKPKPPVPPSATAGKRFAGVDPLTGEEVYR